jgi:ubiquinone/menaquinone biosynthesis C-methylase UbiE
MSSPAEIYEQYMVPAYFGPLSALVVARAQPQPGERVLVVACGTGIVARRIAPLVGASGHVTGLDPNSAMLAVARGG